MAISCFFLSSPDLSFLPRPRSLNCHKFCVFFLILFILCLQRKKRKKEKKNKEGEGGAGKKNCSQQSWLFLGYSATATGSNALQFEPQMFLITLLCSACMALEFQCVAIYSTIPHDIWSRKSLVGEPYVAAPRSVPCTCSWQTLGVSDQSCLALLMVEFWFVRVNLSIDDDLTWHRHWPGCNGSMTFSRRARLPMQIPIPPRNLRRKLAGPW